VLNDLTKRYERVWRGPVPLVAAELREAAAPRGEFVLVLAALEDG
jgi:16S rRNA C1402 (ribose-2'-O) methylase RsmI